MTSIFCIMGQNEIFFLANRYARWVVLYLSSAGQERQQDDGRSSVIQRKAQ